MIDTSTKIQPKKKEKGVKINIGNEKKDDK